MINTQKISSELRNEAARLTQEAAKLQQAAELIETASEEIDVLDKPTLEPIITPSPIQPKTKKKTMSKKARRLISKAQKARWAKFKALGKQPLAIVHRKRVA